MPEFRRLPLVALLTAAAGTTHIAAAVPHFADDAVFGVSFVVAGWAQLALAAALLLRPRRWVLAATALVNVGALGQVSGPAGPHYPDHRRVEHRRGVGDRRVGDGDRRAGTTGHGDHQTADAPHGHGSERAGTTTMDAAHEHPDGTIHVHTASAESGTPDEPADHDDGHDRTH